VHPSCQTLGATSASRSGLRHVYLPHQSRAAIASATSPAFYALLAVTAFRNTPPFGERQSIQSRSNKGSFAFHTESRKLSARNSHAARPRCSTSQPSSPAPGDRPQTQEFTAAVFSLVARTSGTLTKTKSPSCQASPAHECPRASANVSLIYGGT
jgi:hypothetical protein